MDFNGLKLGYDIPGSGGADALSAAGSGGARAQHRQDRRGGTGFAVAGAGVRQLEQHPSGRWRTLKLERGHIALKRKALTVACPKPTSDTSAFEKT